jgi:hypothetical protein
MKSTGCAGISLDGSSTTKNGDAERAIIRTISRLISLVFLTIGAIFISPGQHKGKPFIPVGIFLARVEEGARIFTPVRLLPFQHPESEGHQFPNALQLFGTEFEDILWLGRQAGYELRLTLQRYPREPSPEWPYPEFSQLPDTATLRSIIPIRRSMADAPLKGLRAVLFVNREPVCFIVDTRNLTLAERGMTRSTSMGLDINRSDFLAAVSKAADFLSGQDTASVIFTP